MKFSTHSINTNNSTHHSLLLKDGTQFNID